MPKHKVRCVLFGAPGSGKGTQSRRIAEHFGVPYIGFGDLIRAEIAGKTPLGLIAKPYVEQGMLAPDDLINAILLAQFKQIDPPEGFVIEGFPRTIDQAEFLDKLAKVTIAVHLRVPDETVMARMLGRLTCKKCRAVYNEKTAKPEAEGTCTACGGKLYRRADDTEGHIRARLAAYHFITEPLAAYYRRRGVLLAVKAELSIDTVFQDVVKKMAKLGFSG